MLRLLTGTMMAEIPNWAGVVMALVLAAAPAHAAEKVYEKPSDFLIRNFGEIPKTRVIELNRGQQAAISRMLGHDYESRRIRYWKSGNKTAWILNEIGKTEPITTGYVISAGRIIELQVLIYRESHGWEVSRPFFTRQFKGAVLKGERVDREIDGIVGATLSVRALTKLSAVALYLAQQVD